MSDKTKKRSHLTRSKTLSDLSNEFEFHVLTRGGSRRSTSNIDKNPTDNTQSPILCRKVFKDHGIYEGSLIDGKRNGQGKLMSFDGRRVIYEGNWVNDNRDGYGVNIFNNGDQHHGHYVNGLRHGWGVYCYNNGDKYTGQWKGGLMDGQGKFTWSNGDVYEGEVLQGSITGKGHKHQCDGSTIDGSFIDGQAHGYCTKHYQCGDIHSGDYIHDQRHGYGTYIWTDGYTYRGMWSIDHISGNGEKYVHATCGDNGHVQININRVSSDGDPVACYKGEYKSGLRWGRGTALLWNDDYYEGEWSNNKCHGWGTYIDSNGFIYTGEFHYGSKQGWGILSFDRNLLLNDDEINYYFSNTTTTTTTTPHHDNASAVLTDTSNTYSTTMIDNSDDHIEDDLILRFINRIRLVNVIQSRKDHISQHNRMDISQRLQSQNLIVPNSNDEPIRRDSTISLFRNSTSTSIVDMRLSNIGVDNPMNAFIFTTSPPFLLDTMNTDNSDHSNNNNSNNNDNNNNDDDQIPENNNVSIIENEEDRNILYNLIRFFHGITTQLHIDIFPYNIWNHITYMGNFVDNSPHGNGAFMYGTIMISEGVFDDGFYRPLYVMSIQQ